MHINKSTFLQIDTPAHTYECHGVAGHSTTKEEYHEFVQHHKEKEFDFDQDGTHFFIVSLNQVSTIFWHFCESEKYKLQTCL